MKHTALLCAFALAVCAAPARAEPESAPAGALALMQEADAAYAGGQWAQAETRYLALARRVPQDPYAWFKLGNVLLRSDRPEEAIAAYREALVRDAGHAKAYHNLALAYLAQARLALESSARASAPNDPLSAGNRLMLDQLAALIQGPSDQRLEVKSTPSAPPAPNEAQSPAKPEPVEPAAPALPTAATPSPAEPPTAPVIIYADRQETQPAAGNDEEAPQLYTVVPDGLYLREKPDPAAAIVIRLQKGDTVATVNQAPRNGWRRVRIGDWKGWALARYLAPAEGGAVPGTSQP